MNCSICINHLSPKLQSLDTDNLFEKKGAVGGEHGRPTENQSSYLPNISPDPNLYQFALYAILSYTCFFISWDVYDLLGFLLLTF
jgi:hypothetical protein